MQRKAMKIRTSLDKFKHKANSLTTIEAKINKIIFNAGSQQTNLIEFPMIFLALDAVLMSQRLLWQLTFLKIIRELTTPCTIRVATQKWDIKLRILIGGKEGEIMFCRTKEVVDFFHRPLKLVQWLKKTSINKYIATMSFRE